MIVADKSKGTKTGSRPILVHSQLQPYINTLKSLAKPEQENLFEKYRTHSNIRKSIYDCLEKAGIVKEKGEKPWEKLFNNLRSTCNTLWDNEGLPESLQDIMFGNSAKVRKQHYQQRMKGMTNEEYVGKLLRFYPGNHESEKNSSFFPSFSSNPHDIAEWVWGEVGKSFGLDLTGKELLGGFLASEEFVSAMNGLGTVIPALHRYKNGEIDERQVRVKLKKYLRRTCRDAVDSLDELSQIFETLAEAGLEPAQPYGQGILNP